MSKKLTPIQSIKKYCKEQCCAGDLTSWKECTLGDRCPLFPYRLGKRPVMPTATKDQQKSRDNSLNSSKKGHSDKDIIPKINNSEPPKSKNKLNPGKEEDEI